MRRYDQSVVIAKNYLNQFLESGELGHLLHVRFYLSAGGIIVIFLEILKAMNQNQ